MGAPSINIAFKEQAIAAINKGDKGIVAMILCGGTAATAVVTQIIDAADIPAGYSSTNKGYINQVLKGYQHPPKKIIAVLIEGDSDMADDLVLAEAQLENYDWDYLIMPEATSTEASALATWIKSQRDNKFKKYKAILPNTTADHEGIINLIEGYNEGSTTYTAAEACCRIAGIIAGTPWSMSCTYAPIPEATGITTSRTAAQTDTAVDAGQLCLMWDGEKVKIVRGVNSLTTTSEAKGQSYKKIKLVETMDLIRTDIRKTAEDNYVGKYNNSYDNKCLLTTAINGYFDTLVRDGILASGYCEIDVPAQRNYIKSHGGTFVLDGETINIEDATELQIKMANTGSQVFLRCTISMLDALEDINIDIYF